jgi:hypothetical protein
MYFIMDKQVSLVFIQLLIPTLLILVGVIAILGDKAMVFQHYH